MRAVCHSVSRADRPVDLMCLYVGHDITTASLTLQARPGRLSNPDRTDKKCDVWWLKPGAPAAAARAAGPCAGRRRARCRTCRARSPAGRPSRAWTPCLSSRACCPAQKRRSAAQRPGRHAGQLLSRFEARQVAARLGAGPSVRRRRAAERPGTAAGGGAGRGRAAARAGPRHDGGARAGQRADVPERPGALPSMSPCWRCDNAMSLCLPRFAARRTVMVATHGCA